jgi:hypothetical protein
MGPILRTWDLRELSLIPPRNGTCTDVDALLAESEWWVSCVLCTSNLPTTWWLPDVRDVYRIERPLELLEIVDGHEVRQHFTSRCRPKREESVDVAVVTPTYPPHMPFIAQLARSLLLAHNVTRAPWDFIPVFSSSEDAAVMLPQLRSAAGEVSALSVRPLVFTPLLLKEKQMRFAYQACKKMWAWQHLAHRFLFVIDSDFVLYRPVDLLAVAQAESRRVYYAHFERFHVISFHKKVVEYCADLLKVRRLSYIPIEHPWLIERTQRRAFDATMTAFHGDYISKFLKGARRPVYEIVLYRLWQLRFTMTAESKGKTKPSRSAHTLLRARFPWLVRPEQQFGKLESVDVSALMTRHSYGHLYEKKLSAQERAEIRYPAVASYVDVDEGVDDPLPWLIIHADRSYKKGFVQNFGERMRRVGLRLEPVLAHIRTQKALGRAELARGGADARGARSATAGWNRTTAAGSGGQRHLE